jgi:Co/Zn/Cd efflux system component
LTSEAGADTAWTAARALSDEDRRYRRRVLVIVAVIASLAIGQSSYALWLGDRFLLKDGIDWIYDVILWAVALAVFGRGRRFEELAAIWVGGVMLVAAGHTAYDLWDKIATGRRPQAWVAGWSASTAILLALFVVGLMFRFRASSNPLIKATWLSSRNDTISTTAFALVGLWARLNPSQTPEIILDLVVITLSLQAAFTIFRSVYQDWGRRGAPDGQAGDAEASSRP